MYVKAGEVDRIILNFKKNTHTHTKERKKEKKRKRRSIWSFVLCCCSMLKLLW